LGLLSRAPEAAAFSRLWNEGHSTWLGAGQRGMAKSIDG